MVQIDLGERLIRLADKVLSKNSNETIGHTGGITNATANDTYIPTTKAVKEYVDEHEHQHGNIQNNGSIGSTANKPIITTTNGVLTTGSFGTDANTFCQGNDNRLSDDRNPISHAVNDTRYGAASSTNYGHIRVMDDLTSTGTTDALSANQGKELKTLVDTKVPIADIKDDLTSTDTNKPLSAKQGRLLKSSVDSKANKNHTHANISDSGWQNVSLKDGFTIANNSHPVRYRRIGKIVHLEGVIKNTEAITPSTTARVMGTIDDPYCRPQYEQYAIMQGVDASKFFLNILNTGQIGLSRHGTTATNTQIPVNSWLYINATWMVETENISVETSIMESEDGLNYFLNAYYSSNTSDDPGDSGGIDDIIDDSGGAIDDEQNWTQYDGTPYETFYPYAIQLKSTNNNGGINNKNIQWRIDSTQQTSSVTENNGYAFFKIPYTTWSNKGNHTFTFKFEEDETYRTSSMSTTINYESVTIPTTIMGSISNVSTFFGTLVYEEEDDTANGSVVYQALPNKTIKCYVNNSLKSTTTTSEVGTFSINIDNTSYGANIKIIFEGDMPYRETTYNTTYPYNTGPISM